MYSKTYAGVLAMVLAFILRSVGHELPDEEVAKMASDLILIAGAIHVLYERYMKGGITWHGIKLEDKPSKKRK